MRKLDKILLFLILLIGFGFSICNVFFFCPVPFFQEMALEYQAAFPWLNYIFTGYSVIICLCLLIFLAFTMLFPGKSNLLIIKKEKGELQFSKKTVESTVRYSFAELDGINFTKIRVKIHRKPEKTKVYVKLSLNDTKELVSLTETVQEKISSTLESSLGITVKSITIKVFESKSDNIAKRENGKDNSQDSLII